MQTLTCTGVFAVVLSDVVVLVSFAASVDEWLTGARLSVVVPVLQRRSAGTRSRLRPTAL